MVLTLAEFLVGSDTGSFLLVLTLAEIVGSVAEPFFISVLFRETLNLLYFFSPIDIALDNNNSFEALYKLLHLKAGQIMTLLIMV